MKRVLVIALAVASVAANAQSLYNNATANGLSTSIGIETDVRPAGGFYSVLQTGQTTLGAGANPGARLADDFTVTGAGWNVSSVVLFAYNTNATVPTITGGVAEIRSGFGGGTTYGTVLGTLTYASTAFTDRYRTSTPFNDARRVQAMTFTYSGATLAAGTYHITYNFNLSSTGGNPFVPLLTTAGSSAAFAGANAWQQLTPFATAPFNPLSDGGTLARSELPFWINGQAVPEPGTMIALGLGAAAMIRRRRK